MSEKRLMKICEVNHTLQVKWRKKDYKQDKVTSFIFNPIWTGGLPLEGVC